MAILAAGSVMTTVAVNYQVGGKVADSSSMPEAFATVRVFSSSDTLKAVSLGITGEDGSFSQSLPQSGTYILNITSVGKKPIVSPFSVSQSAPSFDFGTLTIIDNSAELGEVEVVASKPLVVKEIDRIGYDVQADDDSKTSTVQEILRKVPLVTVESDGTIKVRGRTDFKIYKNGRPSNSFTNNAKDIFAAIPASMIKKIEVITDPGAKEDAEGVGAILNIVTMENTSVDGVMGNIRAGAMTNNDWPIGGVWLTGNVGKVTLSANAGMFHQSINVSKSHKVSDYIFSDTGNRQLSETDGRAKGNVYFWGVDGSYELDSLNLFTLEFSGYYYNMKSWSDGTTSMFDRSGLPVYSYGVRYFSPKTSYLDFNGNFNYQHLTHRKDEAITFSYAISNSHNEDKSQSEYYNEVNFPAPYSGIVSDGDINFIEHTFQLDWTRPLGPLGKFSTGAKFIQRNNHSINDFIYVDDRTDHRDFRHRTSVGAAYFDYRLTAGRWNARAGLRYEYSRLAAKFLDGTDDNFASSLNDWGPNASIMYNITKTSALKLAYSTRINRPGISYLNPAVTESPTSVSFGNPDLSSSHHNSLSLNYSLMKQNFSVDLSASFDFANNTIAQSIWVDDNDVTYSTFGNNGRNRSFGLSAFAQWSITRKTSVMLNGSLNYDNQKIPILNAYNHRWGCNIFFRATQQLPWKLRLEGMMFYGTGGLDDVYTYTDNNSRSIYHGFSLQRSFLSEDRLTVKLHARNPFTKRTQWRSVTDRGSYTGYSRSDQLNSSVYAIEVSFRFGSVNAQVKKTAASISNTDLQGGSSAPSVGSNQGGGY